VTFTLGALMTMGLITAAAVSLVWTPTDALAVSIVVRLQARSPSLLGLNLLGNGLWNSWIRRRGSDG